MSYSYINSLSPSERERYTLKLSLVGLKDCPFRLPGEAWRDDPTEWPHVEYPSVYDYLINTPGVFTTESMKNYKSLEAHHFFRAGWVQTVFHHLTTSNNFIFKAYVKPSQRVTEKPHRPWVAVDKDGIVLSAHCDCMAGLGESCSHVAALLFKIEAVVRFGITSLACTYKPCKWNNFFVKDVECSPISGIQSYTNEALNKHKTSTERSTAKMAASSECEQTNFVFALSSCKTSQPVCLSNYHEFCSPFKDKNTYTSDRLPTSFKLLFDANSVKLNEVELSEKCEAFISSLSISDDQINYLESITVNQAQDIVWHEQRIGRITASRVSDIMKTNFSNPSNSLLLNLTSHEVQNLNAPPLVRGRENEPKVFTLYEKEYLSCYHRDGSVTKVGMKLSKEYPWLGASADGLISCSCHGSCTVEIKCPYKFRENTSTEMINDCSSYLHPEGKLNRNHKFAEFIVQAKDKLIVDTIKRDDDFITQTISHLNEFWKKHIFPELVTGRLRTLLKEKEKIKYSVNLGELVCYCQKHWDQNDHSPSNQLTGCDSSNCPYKWIHLGCVRSRQKTVPKGIWYCKECRKK